jgi:hypothetical protein
MTVTIEDRFKLRRGTAANLATVNEVPLAGEIVYETDQGLVDGKYKIKIGDGVTHYDDLPYVSLGGGVENVVPGDGIAVDASDPKNPIVSSTLGSIALTGRVATYAALPSSGLASGDAYLVDADRLVYVWNGTAWPANGLGQSFGSSYLGRTVLASAATDIIVSGLDLDAAGGFTIQVALSVIASCDVSLYYNGDVTASHYWMQQITATGAAVGASRSNTGLVGGSSGAEGLTLDIPVKRDGLGRARAVSQCCRGVPASVLGQTYFHVWTTVANITQITLRCSIANGFAAGSSVRVLRY